MIGKNMEHDLLGIRGLFPDGVAVVSGLVVGMGTGALLPEEEALVAECVDKRRQEFSAGRCCAREALGELGHTGGALLRSARGGVVWPEGYTGAISHTREFCAAVVGRRQDVTGLGLDLENIGRMSERIGARIMTDCERTWLTDQPPEEQNRLRTVFFCAKEAVYKCLSPITQGWIGYDDAHVTIDTAPQSLRIALSDKIAALLPEHARLEGRYLPTDHLMAAGVWLHIA
ncbi:MAG: 4'-phosphopantetheinyl transferase superfamily protein [Spartobacteria bacterium]|nr:4'-phosphopantetheinyl transferase superfamily protein [Spartobacteria bacterium]